MDNTSCRTVLRAGAALTTLTVLCGCWKPTTSPPASRPTQPASTSAPATLDEVRTIVAEQMGVELGELTPTTSLGELGADELDFVELVMELEERFNITIPDEEVAQMMGTDDWQRGMKNVTMEKLATLVDDLKGK